MKRKRFFNSNGGRSAYDQPEAPSMMDESSVQGVVFKYKKKEGLRVVYETKIIQDMTYPRADRINQDGNQDSQ
jgi:hypothetical protein